MDINNIEIRKLSYGDLDQLTMTFGSEFNRTHQDDLIDQEQEIISFYVAWLENNPVGHGLVHWSGAREPEIANTYSGCPEIYRLSVLQEFQSRGIGTRLLQTCEQEAINRNLPLIGIGVGHNNPRALALYKRLGFKQSTINNCIFRYRRQLGMGEVMSVEESGTWMIKTL